MEPSLPVDETPPPRREIEVEIEVRYAETDRMGLVHHSRYLVWFEVARTRLCLETGYHYAKIEEMGYLLVVTRAELTYRQGARYGDAVRVHCQLERFSSRGLRFVYAVRRDGELLVEGATEHIWVEAATGKPCRIPEIIRPGFQRLEAEDLAAGRKRPRRP
jgi:acyl-CoA thioester hydrolase